MRFIASSTPSTLSAPSAPTAQAALDLANTEDVLQHADAVHAHPAVVLHFPKWTDGRAYSQAVLLRGRLRYRGEIRAVGEVLVDMLPLLQRCGFNAVQLRADQNLESAKRALGFFSAHYQTVPPERAAAPLAA
jgi:uncharacterized protein (DUF934 family)